MLGTEIQRFFKEDLGVSFINPQMRKNLIQWYQQVLNDNSLHGKIYHNIMRYIRVFNESQDKNQTSAQAIGIKRKSDTVVVNLPTSSRINNSILMLPASLPSPKKMRFSSPTKKSNLEIDCFLLSPFKQDINNQTCDSLEELLGINDNNQCDTQYVCDLIEENLKLYKLKYYIV